MKLTIFERVYLQKILSEAGCDLTEIKIVSDLRDEAGFTEEEFKKYEIKNKPGGGITWNDREYAKDIEIGEKATEIIVRVINSMAKKKQITLEWWPLCKKFIKED